MSKMEDSRPLGKFLRLSPLRHDNSRPIHAERYSGSKHVFGWKGMVNAKRRRRRSLERLRKTVYIIG